MLVERATRHLHWQATEYARKRLVRNAPIRHTVKGVELTLGDWCSPLIREAIYAGWYEQEEVAIIEQTLRSGDRVLEVGCGAGLTGTIACRIAADVRLFDANPRMAKVAEETLARNGARGTVTAAVLVRDCAKSSLPFYVRNDFWASSLEPLDNATEIQVPTADFANTILEQGTTYLIVDIEGAETELLSGQIPSCIREICVECHPDVTSPRAISEMLARLLGEGFSLGMVHSRPPVLHLERVS
jgi:FkbM family methyltransferase